MFDIYLAGKFDGRIGESKVVSRKYVLEDAITFRRLNRREQWTASFRPGRRFLMSMIFEQVTVAEQSCPGCSAVNGGPSESLTTW